MFSYSKFITFLAVLALSSTITSPIMNDQGIGSVSAAPVPAPMMMKKVFNAISKKGVEHHNAIVNAFKPAPTEEDSGDDSGLVNNPKKVGKLIRQKHSGKIILDEVSPAAKKPVAKGSPVVNVNANASEDLLDWAMMEKSADEDIPVKNAPTPANVYCSDCGTKSQPNDKFCSGCGQKRVVVKSDCDKCGTKFQPNAKFCGECGTKRNP